MGIGCTDPYLISGVGHLFTAPKRKQGIVTYSYFIWYGIGRFFIEGLRTDSLMFFYVRISGVLSMIVFFVAMCILVKKTIKYKRTYSVSSKRKQAVQITASSAIFAPQYLQNFVFVFS